MTYYQKFYSTKRSYVYTFAFITGNSSDARTHRRRSSLIEKALQPTKDFSEDFDGIPQDWTIGPPMKPDFVTTGDRKIIYINGVTIYDYSTRSYRVETRSDISTLDGCEADTWRDIHIACADFSPPTFGAVKTYN